jgi:hypothetical protein
MWGLLLPYPLHIPALRFPLFMVHGDLDIAPEKAIFATSEDLRRNLRGAFRPRIIDPS